MIKFARDIHPGNEIMRYGQPVTVESTVADCWRDIRLELSNGTVWVTPPQTEILVLNFEQDVSREVEEILEAK